MALDFATKKEIVALHVARLQKLIKRWNRHRRWYRSEFWRQPEGELPTGAIDESEAPASAGVESNYPYAFTDTMAANICPLEPAVRARPRKPALVEYAQARTALINDVMRRDKLHVKTWRAVTHASVYQYGIEKAVWDEKLNRAKFRNVDPQRFMFDVNAESWEEIRYAVEIVPMTRQDFMAMVEDPKGPYHGVDTSRISFGQYPAWLRDTELDKQRGLKAANSVFEWILVYEFYDLTDGGGFCHMIDGYDTPLWEGALPYALLPNPFQLLVFNDNLEDLSGMSDVQLIAGLLELLNESDTLELGYLKSTIPIPIVDKSALEDADSFSAAFKNATSPGDFIEVSLRQGKSILDAVQWSQAPSISPGFDAFRKRAMAAIEFLLGIPQYSRGVVGTADVATEVALADTATKTRNGRRQRQVYDLIEWNAACVAALHDEFMGVNETVYLRREGDQGMLAVTRSDAGFQDTTTGLKPQMLDYDYEAVPYSSVESSRLIQLRNIQNTWPQLQFGIQQGHVDLKALMHRILELLTMEDVAGQGPPPTPPGGQGATPGAPGAPGGEDTIAAGGTPGQVGPPLPPMAGGGPGDGGGAPIP